MITHEGKKEGSTLRRISDFLPSSEKSDFIRSDPLHCEMLVRISEIIANRPGVSFNRAVSDLPGPLYGDIVRQGMMFSEVSVSVRTYLEEYPELVDYLSYLLNIEGIDHRGNMRKIVIPSFKTFLQKPRNFTSNLTPSNSSPIV